MQILIGFLKFWFMIGLNYYSRTVKSVSSDHINYSMVETYDSWSIYDSLKCNCLILVDRAERHDLKWRFLLFILLFFFPLFLSGKTKREKTILNHDFKSWLSVRSSCIILPPSVKIYKLHRSKEKLYHSSEYLFSFLPAI